ncbi:MAG: oxidoreductase [Gammaproteobacteria bacterium]|nr:MAG: oxidoreductase [Gammaproteobacteria bacterium]
MFKAIVLRKEGTTFSCNIEDLAEADLPPGDVLVAVEYSTINYKDGLAIANRGPVVRRFPMIPGIDLAGRVLESSHPDYRSGDRVVLNGWGIGETHWGGLAQRARVKGEWLVKLPEDIDTRSAMAIGTAGYTAMLSVLALEKNQVLPGSGEIIVTGAAGGVGSIAVAILARLGYNVTASTGRPEEADYLRALGAITIIHRDEINKPGKPLQSERWAGAVDTVGSHTLANVLASTRQQGTVTCCGLAQGGDLPTTVMPFILRAVRLVGISSVLLPHALRLEAWSRLATDLDRAKLASISSEVALSEGPRIAEEILAGHIRGRVIVDVNR